MPRDEVLGRAHAEALGQHGAQRLDLHLAEAGQRGQPPAQVVAVGRLGPHARRVAAVLVADVHRQRLDTLGHRAGEAVDRRLLAQDGLEVGAGERGRVQRPDPLAQDERPRERLLHRHLLVEDEAHEERHRVAGDQRVGLVGLGEVQAVGHEADRIRAQRSASGTSGSASRASSTTTWSRMSRCTSVVTSQTLTFIPAAMRSPVSQNAMNSRPATSPRNTTRSHFVAWPEYSIPTSNWSEKKYGTRAYGSSRSSIESAAAGPWFRALAQCSTRIGSM